MRGYRLKEWAVITSSMKKTSRLSPTVNQAGRRRTHPVILTRQAKPRLHRRKKINQPNQGRWQGRKHGPSEWRKVRKMSKDALRFLACPHLWPSAERVNRIISPEKDRPSPRKGRDRRIARRAINGWFISADSDRHISSWFNRHQKYYAWVLLTPKVAITSSVGSTGTGNTTGGLSAAPTSWRMLFRRSGGNLKVFFQAAHQ